MLLALLGPPQSVSDTALALRQAKALVLDAYVTGMSQAEQRECHGRGLGECMEGDWSCIDFVCPTGLAGERMGLMARLEGLARGAGSSEWLFRQRVALAVKSGQFERAVAIAGSCRGDQWWCQSLRGFAAHRLTPGDGIAHFDSAFALLSEHPRRSAEGGWAWGLGPDASCTWADPRSAAPSDLLAEVREWSCPDSAEQWARFWWLADPLWSRPGNERYLEHLSRQVMIRMALDVLEEAGRADEAWVRRDDYDLGPYAIARRQGFPNSRRRLEYPVGRTAVGMIGSAPYVEGGYSFAPDVERFLHPLRSTADEWAIAWRGPGCASPWTERAHRATGQGERIWLGREERLETCGQERYIPRETWHDLIDQQTAVFRRAGGLLVVAAARPPTGMAPPGTLRAALALGRVDDLRIWSTPATIDALGAVRARALLPDSGHYLVSVEVVGPGHVARARFGMPTPPLNDGFGVSDLAIVRAPAGAISLPLERALIPSLTIPADLPVGVYFEVYGLQPDEDVELSLEVQDSDAGWLERLGRFLRITSARRPVEVRWRDPGTGRQGIKRVFYAFDAANLGKGQYRLTVGVRREDGREATRGREVAIR